MLQIENLADIEFSDAMLDIETLDTVKTSVVLSIGLVLFKLSPQNKINELFHSSFYTELDCEEQELIGRTKSESTMAFWKRQKPGLEQFKYAYPISDKITVNNKDCLTRLHQILKKLPKNGGLWAKGYDFDLEIISNLFGDYGLTTPWQFHQKRCYRTMERWFKSRYPEFEFPKNTHLHHALEDARHQTVCLDIITRKTLK